MTQVNTMSSASPNDTKPESDKSSTVEAIFARMNRRDRPVRSVGSACCDRVRLVDVRYGLYVSIEPGITEAGNCGDYGFPEGECQAHVARSCQR